MTLMNHMRKRAPSVNFSFSEFPKTIFARLRNLQKYVLAVFMGGLAGSAYAGWQITDLGTLGGSASYASAINDKGQVVGESMNTEGVWKAFLYEDGAMVDISRSNPGQAKAFGINDNGQVTGLIHPADSAVPHAFLYRNGSMTDIAPAADPGKPNFGSYGKAINDKGQVVGVNNYRATLFEHGTATDLGTLGGHLSMASGINSRGEIVGGAEPAWSRSFQAFIYRDGKMTNLGALGPDRYYANKTSFAVSINDHGVAVGSSSTGPTVTPAGGYEHAVIFKDGKVFDLGTLGGNSSKAVGINNQGQVVGASDTVDGKRHAFLYMNGVMTDLAALPEVVASGFVPTVATGINNAGQIAGAGIINGQEHAYLLSPTSETDSYLQSPFGKLAPNAQ